MTNKTFNAFKREKNREPVFTGGDLLTSDADALDSPHSYDANGNDFAMNIPTNAAEVILYPSTALRVSEDINLNTYFVIPAGTVITIGVANTDKLYFDADTDAGTLNFAFVTI